MSSRPTPDEIARDATWLAQAMDTRQRLVRLIRMTPEAYRDASFLDDRVLAPRTEMQVLAWEEVAPALADEARSDARWVFHIGHVGSTLVARLLGELDNVLALREPRILRDIALLLQEERAPLVPALRRLMSRSFEPGQHALVKATSFVSEMAPELAGSDGKALFLYAGPRGYIATMLAGENSVKELAALASWRAQRSAERVGTLSEAGASQAHLAAAAWACEMTALEAAGDSCPDALWSDFDRFLDDVPGELARIADHFAFHASPEQLKAVADGPLMRRYSKALEYEYSPGLRRELLTEAEQAHRGDIERALAMLRRASETSPLLARALSRAEPES